MKVLLFFMISVHLIHCTLYGISAANYQLQIIDTASGSLTPLGQDNPSFGIQGPCAVDASYNVFYTVSA